MATPPTYFDLDVARQIGSTFTSAGTGRVVWNDSVQAVFGTDLDVSVAWTGSLLAVKDSVPDTIMEFTPASSLLEMIWPSAAAGETPTYKLFHANPSPRATLEDLGAIDFACNNASAIKRTMARIVGEILDGTNTGEAGSVVTQCMSNGTMTDLTRVSGDLFSLGASFFYHNSNFGSDGGRSLLVQGNQAAFRFDQRLAFGGAIPDPTPAGLFFAVGDDGFEFRDVAGSVVGKFAITHVGFGGTGGCKVPTNAVSVGSGYDTLTAGQLNIAPLVATSVKCFQNFEMANAKNFVTNTSTGSELPDTASQKLGFWGVTPIIQPVNTVALDTLLVNTGLRASGGVALFDTDVKVNVVGNGIYVKEGSNATMGRATLVAGVATVLTTKVTAVSEIFAFNNVPGGTVGLVRVSARTAGVSFVLTSSSTADTSTYAWLIMEPA